MVYLQLSFAGNLSGAYQQVIPRYISLPADEDPLQPISDPIEFLQDYFPEIQQLATAIFLKGYQWPFDAERIENYGSSLINLAVYEETIGKGRRVYLDFQHNPEGFSLDNFEGEGKDYLVNSGVEQILPIDRLQYLNPHSLKLYEDHGIDLRSEYLEIRLCAQHCNGGIKGDIWWQTNIPQLFVIGEANGSHGVHRPGGSALNAGQVGGIRCAEKIAYGDWELFN